jgi:hypothetical protein
MSEPIFSVLSGKYDSRGCKAVENGWEGDPPACPPDGCTTRWYDIGHSGNYQDCVDFFCSNNDPGTLEEYCCFCMD